MLISDGMWVRDRRGKGRMMNSQVPLNSGVFIERPVGRHARVVGGRRRARALSVPNRVRSHPRCLSKYINLPRVSSWAEGEVYAEGGC